MLTSGLTTPERSVSHQTTEIGKHIFVELLFKWFAYTDNESGKIDRKNNIKMLEKYYNQLLQKIDRK